MMALKWLVVLFTTCICCCQTHFLGESFSNFVSDSEIEDIVEAYLDEHDSDYEEDQKRCKLPDECKIGLAEDATAECKKQRMMDIMIARAWYQVANENSSTNFPLKGKVPFMAQTIESMRAMTAVNPKESRWLSLIGVMSASFNETFHGINAQFGNKNVTTLADFKMIRQAYDRALQGLAKKLPPAKAYFDRPSLYPDTFELFYTTDKWKTDQVFVQRRFADGCPFFLRKVTEDGKIGFKASKLVNKLNPIYDYTHILTKAYGKPTTMQELISDGRLFALYHGTYNNIENHKNMSKSGSYLYESVTPISLFVLTEDGEMKVAAIQEDSDSLSPVYTPESAEDEWMLAKGLAEKADRDICDAKVHYSYIHIHHTAFCLLFRRHLSKQHPLYDVFTWHCYGTVPAITITYEKGVSDNDYAHKAYGMGSKGFSDLVLEGFQKSYYGQYEIEHLLKNKGLDDKRIKYYPWRDDARVIATELKRFARVVVKKYYKDDLAVQNDSEFEGYLNELSKDGTKGKAGGQIDKLPTKFETKEELSNFLYIFLFNNIIHNTANYQLGNTFIPSNPYTLHKNFETGKDGYLYNLGSVQEAIYAMFIPMQLGSLRANRLFDYSAEVRDKKLARLVQRAYGKMRTCVQKELEGRNAQRKSDGHLTYQYLEPKWMANSVHI